MYSSGARNDRNYANRRNIFNGKPVFDLRELITKEDGDGRKAGQMSNGGRCCGNCRRCVEIGVQGGNHLKNVADVHRTNGNMNYKVYDSGTNYNPNAAIGGQADIQNKNVADLHSMIDTKINKTEPPGFVHKPIYDMQKQKEIHQLQGKPLMYTCPGGVIVSSDGTGVENYDIKPDTTDRTLNCRFS